MLSRSRHILDIYFFVFVSLFALIYVFVSLCFVNLYIRFVCLYICICVIMFCKSIHQNLNKYNLKTNKKCIFVSGRGRPVARSRGFGGFARTPPPPPPSPSKKTHTRISPQVCTRSLHFNVKIAKAPSCGRGTPSTPSCQAGYIIFSEMGGGVQVMGNEHRYPLIL